MAKSGARKSLQVRLLACGGIVAYCLAGAMPAWAEEPVKDSADEGEIVVTAQKKPEQLLKAPISLSVVSSQTLVDQNLVRLSDYYNRVPGIQYTGDRTTGIAIRGITTAGTTTATVAIVMDDIPLGASTIAGQPTLPDFDPATLERIEVLRGPQGTLYGASSLGGLIRYVTRSPDTQKFSGRIEAGTNFMSGGTEGASVRGSVNIPIAEDLMALSVSGFYRDDPRWLDNIDPATSVRTKNVNRRESWGGRAALKITPTENLTMTLSALKQRVATNYSELSTSGQIRTTPNFDPAAGIPNLTTIKVAPSSGEIDYQVYSAKGELRMDWATLSSTTAWSRADNLVVNDVTTRFGFFKLFYPSPASATVNLRQFDTTRKFSQEIRLANSGPVVDWLLGGFYTSEHSNTNQTFTLSDPVATPLISSGPVTYREYAAFANATYHVTPQWNVQVGGRYSKNKLASTDDNYIDPPLQPIFGPNTTPTTTTIKDHAFTWLVSSDYNFSNDLMAYARVATGYRPGGSNTSGFGPAAYDSDRVTNYEAGLKGYALSRKVSFELALFQIDWKDIQLQNTDTLSQIGYFTNGGKARSRGAELTLQVKPWTGMVVDANAAYTDAQLTQDLPVASGSSGLYGKDGDRLPYSAKFTTSISARQSFDINEQVNAFFGGTFTHVGDRAGAFQNTEANPAGRLTLPAYSLVDLQAGVTVDSVWHLNAYVRNLFNKYAVISAVNSNGLGAMTTIFNPRRTIGFTVARDF